MGKKIVKPLLIVAAVAVNVIPGVGQVLSAAMITAITTAGVTAAVGMAADAIGLGPKSPKINAATAGRLNANVNPSEPRKAVFGRTALATDVRYQEWTGFDQQYFHQVIVTASHKIHAYDEIWLEDKLAWSAAGGVQGEFVGYLTVDTRLEGGAETYDISGKWGSNRKLTGLASVHLRFKVTGNSKKKESPFASNIPSRMTIIGRAMPVYDPRFDSTVGGVGAMRANDQSTWAYEQGGQAIGRIPSNQLLTWLLGWRINGKLAVGRGVPPERIDFASFITSANACDEPVTLAAGGTEPRYRGDGITSEAEAPPSVIEAFEVTMNAKLRDAGGRFSLTVISNDLGLPRKAFNDNDVLGGFDWEQTPPLQDTFNVVRGRFVNPSTQALYQLVDYPRQRITSPDGIERVHPFDLPMVQSGSQAQRLAKQQLARNLYRGRFSCNLNHRAWSVQLGDIVTLTFSALGWEDKLFRIAEHGINANGVVPVVLQEEHPDIYLWDAEDSPVVQPLEPTTYDHLKSVLIQLLVAGEIDYADGSDLQSLQPAQLGADVTGDNEAASIFGQGIGATANSLGDLDPVALARLNAAVAAFESATRDGILSVEEKRGLILQDAILNGTFHQFMARSIAAGFLPTTQNYVPRSEQLAAWTQAGVVTTTGVTRDPLGGSGGSKVETSSAGANARHILRAIIKSVAVGELGTASAFVKLGKGFNFATLYFSTGYAGVARFDLRTGQPVTVSAGASPWSYYVGDGWWRIGVNFAFDTAVTNPQFRISFSDLNQTNSSSALPVGAHAFAWGAQVGAGVHGPIPYIVNPGTTAVLPNVGTANADAAQSMLLNYLNAKAAIRPRWNDTRYASLILPHPYTNAPPALSATNHEFDGASWSTASGGTRVVPSATPGWSVTIGGSNYTRLFPQAWLVPPDNVTGAFEARKAGAGVVEMRVLDAISGEGFYAQVDKETGELTPVLALGTEQEHSYGVIDAGDYYVIWNSGLASADTRAQLRFYSTTSDTDVRAAYLGRGTPADYGREFLGVVSGFSAAINGIQLGATALPLQTEWSTNGQAPWHAVFAVGDKYMRQSTDGGVTWTAAIKVVGEDGGVAATGNKKQHVFQRSASAPATPSGNNIPANWSDGPPADNGLPLWMSVSEQNSAGVLVVGWSIPVRLDGEDGLSGNKPDLKFARSASQPATPVGNDPAGWTDGIPEGTLPLWCIRANKTYAGAIIGGWQPPQLIAGQIAPVDYTSAATYYRFQTVTYNGGTYMLSVDSSQGFAPSGTAQSNARWDVLAAPGAQGAPAVPPAGFNSSLNVPAGANVNLRTVADAAGYPGGNCNITFTVQAGTVIRGAAGGLGIDVGIWPSGYSITLALVVAGTVEGGGGYGGGGGSQGSGGSPGTKGGDAIYCRRNITITINGGGAVRGGGGGGGGTASTVLGFKSWRGGNGGGGGAPNGPGGSAGEGDLNGSAGAAGTTGGGGAPGGGNYGAGGSGGAGGGAAGYAVRKNGFTVPVTNNGTLTGTAA